MNIKKLAYSINDAVIATSYSRSHIYLLIKENRLKTYKVKGRTFILPKDLINVINEDYTNGT